LREGQQIDQAEVERAVFEEEKRSAKECALNVLSYRDRSKKEIRDKLLGKGYTPQIVDTVISDLTAVGLVDENRFARAWIRDRVQSGKKGTRLVQNELLKKGVAKDTIAEALEEEPVDEEAVARELVQKYGSRLKSLEPRKLKKRLYDLLLRRGFSYATVQNVLKVDETDNTSTAEDN
jgi:regulatory protein